MIKAGITGGSGYTAGELIRLLLNHPGTTIDFVFSTSKAGDRVASVHRDLEGETDLMFSDSIHPDIDILFLCMGHGNSRKFLDKYSVPENVKIIDLSRDFRLSDSSRYNGRSFVYGLPELNKKEIREAVNIANPGCFATAIELALLPMADEGRLRDEVHIHGITGSTGAGGSLRNTTHFSWRNENISIYKALSHQHLDEIRQSIQSLQPEFNPELNFVPVRGNFTRGIFVTAYTNSELSTDKARKLFRDFYSDAPFTHISDRPLYLKQVVNTNKCLLHTDTKDGKLLVTAIIDNLLKGASGQAVQNMNLMFGLDETTGLNLKSTQF